MEIQPYRWALSPSFVAHLWRAATQQHHRALRPVFARYIPCDGVVLTSARHRIAAISGVFPPMIRSHPPAEAKKAAAW
jgi:hypothetical protein